MNLEFIRKLEIPMKLKELYPLSDALKETVRLRDIELKNILSGKDKRLILIIGPCSADNVDSVIDYCVRLKDVYEKVKNKVMIIPRIYTSKPRTTLSEYKGLLHKPDPSGIEDMYYGIISVRKLHMKVIEMTGLNGADELLYTENYKYFDDMICYSTIGARSVENQEHRLLASGLSIPVGMKNPMNGDFNVMLNSIVAAQNKHTFIYRGYEVKSLGNRYAHAIIRGYCDKYGVMQANYHYDDLKYLKKLYDNCDVENKSIIVDCNHANSSKNPLLQEKIVDDVLDSIRHDNSLNSIIKGFMIESYIETGNQKIGDNIYGKSITDACLSFEKSKEIILKIADFL